MAGKQECHQDDSDEANELAAYLTGLLVNCFRIAKEHIRTWEKGEQAHSSRIAAGSSEAMLLQARLTSPLDCAVCILVECQPDAQRDQAVHFYADVSEDMLYVHT
jgi:hypothetical protein